MHVGKLVASRGLPLESCSRSACARAGGMFRCSRCGRKRRGYDRGGGRRRWRHRDFGCRRVEPVAGMPRVDRPRCGVVVAMAPWAEPGSRFTRDFESECAWLTRVANRKTASGFPQPHPRDRRTRPEDPPSWARHPQDNRTGLLQRQARGVQQQDQGHHPHGLRLPPRHRPHRPDHAPMQRTRHPATTTHNLTHKNSRSLKDRYSCRAFWVIPRAWVDWHAVGEILAERCMPAHGNGWPAGKEYDANGSGGA